MKILIIEDEFPTAEYNEQLCREILGKRLTSVHMVHDLNEALAFIQTHDVDLCLLDLNLHGEDGYELLKTAIAQHFHTIIISAYPDQAIRAFQYGVLDFIVKPFGKARLEQALKRFREHSSHRDLHTRYLSVRDQDRYKLVQIEDVLYMKSAGSYVELFLKNDKKELLHKSMNRLEQILPANFFRIHRSYIVNIGEIETFQHAGSGIYEVALKNKSVLPLSRTKYKMLYDLFVIQ